MLDSEDTHEQNVRERIARDGRAAEAIREVHVERLKSHMEAFYEHGSTIDIIALCQTFDLLQRKEFRANDLHRAQLIEELCTFRELIGA